MFDDSAKTHCTISLRNFVRLNTSSPGAGLGDIALVKEELTQIYIEKYQGAAVCSRGERYLLVEEPTKRALSAEKMYDLTKNIAEQEHRNTIMSDKGVIQSIFVDDYRNILRIQTIRVILANWTFCHTCHACLTLTERILKKSLPQMRLMQLLLSSRYLSHVARVALVPNFIRKRCRVPSTSDI